MRPSSSRVPAVVDALVTRLSATLGGTAGPLGDVQVLDGPRAAEDVRDDVLLVGVSGEGVSSINATTRSQGMGGRLAESFEVQCLISSLSGEPGMKQRRDRAAAVFAAVDGALRGDQTLDGVCDQVMLGPDVAWVQAQTPQGPVCEVAFTVTGQAWL